MSADSETALGRAVAVCRALAATETLSLEQREQRREAWSHAQKAGATYEQIAGECGVSKPLVIHEIARFRKKVWAESW